MKKTWTGDELWTLLIRAKESRCTFVLADLSDMHIVVTGYGRRTLNCLAKSHPTWAVIEIEKYERYLEKKFPREVWEPPIDNEV